jgi:hypothetical protein
MNTRLFQHPARPGAENPEIVENLEAALGRFRKAALSLHS